MTATDAVYFALQRVREESLKCGVDDIGFAYAMGQLIVAELHMHAPAHIVDGARNEIAWLYRSGGSK